MSIQSSESDSLLTAASASLISRWSDRSHKLDKLELKKLSRNAWWVCVASVAGNILIGAVGIFLYVTAGSSASLSYACGSLVDMLTTFVVLWRLGADVEDDLNFLVVRERQADMAVSALFIFVGIYVIVESTEEIIWHEELQNEAALVIYWFGAASGLLGVTLGNALYYLSIRLESEAMRKDAIATILGGVLGVSICVSVFLNYSEGIWYVDSMLGLALGLFLFGTGASTLYSHRHWRWFDKSFWASPDPSVTISDGIKFEVLPQRTSLDLVAMQDYNAR